MNQQAVSFLKSIDDRDLIADLKLSRRMTFSGITCRGFPEGLLSSIFNKFDGIFRAGFYTLVALDAIFRAGYNCSFYSINFFNIKNFCRANLVAGKSPRALFIVDYWMHFPSIVFFPD